MNCPKCNSANVAASGKGMWCKDCWHRFKADEKPVAGVEADAGSETDTADQLYCPECNSTKVRVAGGLMGCSNCGEVSELSWIYKTRLPKMIRCPHCAREVSINADACPGCGEPLGSVLKHAKFVKEVERAIKRQRNINALIFFGLFVLWILLSALRQH